MELKEFLNRLGKDIDLYHDYVNQGGCGVYASLVGAQLKAMGYDVRIVSIAPFFGTRCNLDTVRRFNSNLDTMRAWDDVDVKHSHLLVHFVHAGKPYLCDSNGVWAWSKLRRHWHHKRADSGKRVISRLSLHDGFLTLDEVTRMAATAVGWNCNFDRAQIPDMAELIKKRFRHYRESCRLNHEIAAFDRREKAALKQPAYTRLNIRFFERRPRTLTAA